MPTQPDRSLIRTLAAMGLRGELIKTQDLLAAYCESFPELFVNGQAPRFLVDAPTSNGATHEATPSAADDVPRDARGRSIKRPEWTPERRKKHQAKMRAIWKRKRQAAAQAKAAAAAPPAATSSAINPTLRQLHAHLAKKGPARLADLTRAVHAKHPSNVLGFLSRGIKYGIISRQHDGAYTIGPSPLPASE